MKIGAFVTRSIGILQIVLVAFGCAAGAASAADLAQPITLVATPALANSEFRETVLFAAPLPNGMHLGFIVNKPSEVPLAAAFPEHAASRKVVDPVYIGGPVMPEMVYAAVRTPPKDIENLVQLMPGVVLVMDGDAIDRIIETTPNDARYFIGLIVWQPGELDEEIRAGAWDVKPGDASTVFSAQPETLWQNLSHQGGRQEARSTTDRPRV